MSHAGRGKTTRSARESAAPGDPRQARLRERRAHLTPEQRALLERRLAGKGGAGPGPGQASPAACLVPIEPGGARPPLFTVHPAGGDVLCFSPLARRLGPAQPFYGLQSRGLAGGEPQTSVEEMAALYLQEIRRLRPLGPYHLGGWSLGGLVAFEMARQLQAAGQEVALLAILDTVPHLRELIPPEAEDDLYRDDARWLMDIAAYVEGLWHKELGLSYEGLRDLPEERRLALFVERLKATELLPRGGGVPQLARLLQVFKANTRAGLAYEPGVYAGRITLFRAADGPPAGGGDAPGSGGPGAALARFAADPALGWGELSSCGVTVHTVPGSHLTLMAEPHVAELARRLAACLGETGTTAPPARAVRGPAG